MLDSIHMSVVAPWVNWSEPWLFLSVVQCVSLSDGLHNWLLLKLFALHLDSIKSTLITKKGSQSMSILWCTHSCLSFFKSRLLNLNLKNSLAFTIKLLFQMSKILTFPPGLLKVILGGGRMYMTPKGTPDPEYPTSSSRKGDRKDKINLIDVWLKAKPVRLNLY